MQNKKAQKGRSGIKKLGNFLILHRRHQGYVLKLFIFMIRGIEVQYFKNANLTIILKTGHLPLKSQGKYWSIILRRRINRKHKTGLEKTRNINHENKFKYFEIF